MKCLFLAVTMAATQIISPTIYKQNAVVRSVSASETIFETPEGNLWSWEGKLQFREEQEVEVTFSENGTWADRKDDIIQGLQAK